MSTTAPAPLSDEELLLGTTAPAGDAPADPVEPEDLCEDLLGDLPAERRAYFQVVDEDTAAWVVDRILVMDERNARYEAQMKAKLAAMKKDRERFVGRFLPQLQAWADTVRPDRIDAETLDDKKPKFLDLDAGRIGFRKAKRSAKVVNEETTIGYLRDLAYLGDMLSLVDGAKFSDVLAFLDRPGFAVMRAAADDIVAEYKDHGHDECAPGECPGEAAVLAFLRESVDPELAALVREETVFKLQGDQVRARVLETGEALPGVELVPERENFYFQAPAKAKS